MAIDESEFNELLPRGVGATDGQVVQGKPVAADTMDSVTATRQADVTVVKVSDNERYDIPDVFLNGG